MTSSTLPVAPSNKTVKAPRSPRATAAVSEQQVERIREYFRKVLCSRVDVAQGQVAFREPFRVANPAKKRTQLGVACDQNRTPLVPPSGVLRGLLKFALMKLPLLSLHTGHKPILIRIFYGSLEGAKRTACAYEGSHARGLGPLGGCLAGAHGVSVEQASSPYSKAKPGAVERRAGYQYIPSAFNPPL
jgi:hypothetical protein